MVLKRIRPDVGCQSEDRTAALGLGHPKRIRPLVAITPDVRQHACGWSDIVPSFSQRTGLCKEGSFRKRIRLRMGCSACGWSDIGLPKAFGTGSLWACAQGLCKEGSFRLRIKLRRTMENEYGCLWAVLPKAERQDSGTLVSASSRHGIHRRKGYEEGIAEVCYLSTQR